KIRHSQGRVVGVYGRTEAGEMVDFSGDHIIATLPLGSLIRAMDPWPPDEVLPAATRLSYRDSLTAALLVRREAVFADIWLYSPSPEVKIGRIQNYKNWSACMVPDQSKTSLGLEYFLWQEDDMWRWSDDQLVDFGIRECATLGLIEAG